MNFQDDLRSIPIEKFKDHYVLIFDLTSVQDATEKCHYSKLVGKPLRLKLNFTFPPEHITEPIVLEERMFSVQLTSLVLLEKNLKWIMFLSSKYSEVFHSSSGFFRYCGCFPSD